MATLPDMVPGPGGVPSRAGPAGELPEIAPGILRLQAAFRRDLPELLKVKKYDRRWVAYHGDECVGIAKDPVDLYEECARRGKKAR
jgi:hypothetical protein